MASPCPFADCGGSIFVRKFAGGFTAFGCDAGSHEDSAIRHKLIAELNDFGAETEAEMDVILRRCDPVAWVRDKVLEAREMPDEKFKQEQLDKPIKYLSPYPTGFVGNERGVLLDLRGMTTLSGKASSGKSWFALGASLLAAIDGWDVHYLAAEGKDVLQRRIAFAYGMEPPKSFRLHSVKPGVTVDVMIDQIADWIVSEKTLLVIDSISTMMELMAFAEFSDRWREQAKLEMFLLRLRELTEGAVSILNLSEVNSAGEAKGRTLDHRSDVGINFKSLEDSDGKAIRVTKAWEGQMGIVGIARVNAAGPGLELVHEGAISDSAGTGDF